VLSGFYASTNSYKLSEVRRWKGNTGTSRTTATKRQPSRSPPALISCARRPTPAGARPIRHQGAGQEKRHGGPYGHALPTALAAPTVRRSATFAGTGQGVTGWVRVAPQGCSGVQASGRAVGKGWGDFTLRSVRHPSAARLSPTRPRATVWLRPLKRSLLGAHGQVHEEVGRRPACHDAGGA
jgi:hypothetical protein